MNEALPRASAFSMRLFTSRHQACVLLIVWFASLLGGAHAQSERHGIRVRYTSLGSAGGLEGRAFLPVSTQGVSEEGHADPACKGQPMLTLKASLNRGPMRALRLRLPAQKLGRLPLGESGCTGASIEATLEDATTLSRGQGYVEVQSLPSAADPTYRGVFAQTTSRRDVPVTIEGQFVVPAAKGSTLHP